MDSLNSAVRQFSPLKLKRPDEYANSFVSGLAFLYTFFCILQFYSSHGNMVIQGLMQNHEQIFEYFKAKGVSVIFLFRRNLLRRMISILGNTYDRDFKLLNGTHKSHVHSPREAEILASYKPVINTTTLIRELKQVQKTMTKALGIFNSTRHIVLYYEDVLNNRTKLLDVQDFLRVPRRNLTSRQVKIHKGSFSDHVANWDDVKRTLNGTEFDSFLHADYSL
ncbi:hypothetical protein Cgig2_020059 [Carnegiea gigantea]|uniref:Sulfotransferase n=1 Tax=Carnegiea gigantea TaxID=171969 RepID=A0A9Q1QHF1_9CARY|nr:hypothetical protein Cgig2_020059 [Carnegiea gigantea]